ncbi:hypothetical protein Ddye_032335 [Dipteronia dyeriana]|uniref:HAT C-terminal dimerisation domain-containing protein n=1 Tax=Dipteronia dyeriana TaxID=168575 RepID=A0AAD9TKK4_9ROSI|nr:hypothetical protein Ddye_032335 [Dipteronia dyeriana]
MLCQALQMKSQDILNALNFVSTTKMLLQNLRENGWNAFFKSVVSFCERHDIDMPNMCARYMEGRRRQKDNITSEQHYHFNIFNNVIDFQLMELNSRFTDQTIELLTLSLALNPINRFKSFDIDAICILAKNFYPQDFSQNEIGDLSRQLKLYKFDVVCSSEFQNIASLSELCHRLVETRRPEHFLWIDRLICLVLTLSVSTAMTIRTFSAMKHIKTSLRKKMEDEFLANCLVVYVEREITDTIDLDSIIDEFDAVKTCKIKLR